MTKYVIFGARGCTFFLIARYTTPKEFCMILDAIDLRVLDSARRCDGRLMFVLLESMPEV